MKRYLFPWVNIEEPMGAMQHVLCLNRIKGKGNFKMLTRGYINIRMRIKRH